MGFVDALDHVKSDGEQNATPFGMDNNKVLFDSAKPKRDKRKKTDRPKPVDLEVFNYYYYMKYCISFFNYYYYYVSFVF